MKIKVTAIVEIPDEVSKGNIEEVYDYVKEHLILPGVEIVYAEPWK